MSEQIERKIESDIFIPFEWRTDKYGRAEFQICPVYKRGKLVQCYIYPRQQPNAKEYFLWEGKAEGYSFTGYEDLGYAHIWMNGWCKEHKCNTVRLYVPNDAQFLWIDMSLGRLGINFTKTDWRSAKELAADKKQNPSRAEQGFPVSSSAKSNH